MNTEPDRQLILWAGVAGLLAALGWIVGDILLVGHQADHAAYPLLFQTYADRIDVDMAEALVDTAPARMAAGALIAVFTMPLYLIGTWHLWRGIRGAGRAWALPAATLMFVGYALSPLPHAAFYYVGRAYQSLLVADPAAHSQLLALAADFLQMLMISYVPAVACQFLGMLAFALAVATGRSIYPRWFALTANPVVLLALTVGAPLAIGGVVGDALVSAAYNVAWLLVYAQSLLLWRSPREAQVLP